MSQEPVKKKRTWLKVIAGLFLVFVAAIGTLLVVVAMRPDKFHIERSAQVKVPPATVFPLVNDFHGWTEWSPWDKLDPNLKRTYSREESGKGAVYAWAGNDEVGEGKMTILESKPDELVVIKLEFLKPFAATNRATFKLAAADGGTHVTWSMDGNNNFMGKAIQLIMDMDKIVGKDFETGLANLNAASQAKAGKPAPEKGDDADESASEIPAAESP